MASSGGLSEALGAGAAVSTSTSGRCKLKRTPVILNVPRRPEVAHFKVLQWNVLADGLAQNGDFCKVPPGCLEWEYRRPLLIEEILEANADIICLQELNHFEELRQVLSGLGYEGAFREKHASPALKYEYPPDGMAVFYRSRRFRCNEEAVQGRSFQCDQTGREQSQGFLQILLYDMLVGRELLVVTTHLKAKDGAECEDVRYRQASQLLNNITETLHKLEEQRPQLRLKQHEQAQQQAAVLGCGARAVASSDSDTGAGAASAPAAAAAGPGTWEAESVPAVSSNGCCGSGSNGAAGSHPAEASGGGRNGGGGTGPQPTAGPVVAGGVGAGCSGGSVGNGNGHGHGSSNGGGTGNGKEAHSGQQNGAGNSGGGSREPGTTGSNGVGLFAGRSLGAGSVSVVVTGDFNTMPGSKTCEVFRRHPLGLRSLWEQRPLDATLSSCSGSDLDGPLPPPPAAASSTPSAAAPTTAAAAVAGGNGAGGGGPLPADAGHPPTSHPLAAEPPAAAAAAAAAVSSWWAPERPEFSTWKFRVKGESKRISDYIWFSGAGGLRPLQRWRMLTEEEIGPTALPSSAYASDHISLCCEFEWDVDVDLEWAPPAREPEWG